MAVCPAIGQEKAIEIFYKTSSQMILKRMKAIQIRVKSGVGIYRTNGPKPNNMELF